MSLKLPTFYHKLMDEALADHMLRTRKLMRETSVQEWLDWLGEMAKEPDHDQEKYSHAEHIARHQILYQEMTVLTNLFVEGSRRTLADSNLTMLMEWSFERTQLVPS